MPDTRHAFYRKVLVSTSNTKVWYEAMKHGHRHRHTVITYVTDTCHTPNMHSCHCNTGATKKVPLLWEKSGGPPILCTKNSYWFWIASSFLEFANMERNHSSSSSS